jgi:hypothetical protein
MKSYKETLAQTQARLKKAKKAYNLTGYYQRQVLIKVIAELTLDPKRIELAFICALRDLGHACETTFFSAENKPKSTQK